MSLYCNKDWDNILRKKHFRSKVITPWFSAFLTSGPRKRLGSNTFWEVPWHSFFCLKGMRWLLSFSSSFSVMVWETVYKNIGVGEAHMHYKSCYGLNNFPRIFSRFFCTLALPQICSRLSSKHLYQSPAWKLMYLIMSVCF